jgi:predicted transcriptional regulator of viral defense system
MKNAITPQTYIASLQAKGHSTFTTQDFRNSLSLTATATRFAIYRLKQKREIATPVQGFHLILTPEYRYLACLPPELMIDQLMSYLRLPYYVGLLSAAENHGAAHQRPQKYQVVTAKKRRNIICGKVEIDFFQKTKIQETLIESRNVKSGTIKISSPELTALDLVGYQQQSGGLQHVLTVLAELSEEFDEKKLLEAAKLCSINWVQRLGVLLEMLGKDAVAKELKAYVNKKARNYVPLVLGGDVDDKNKNPDWKVFVNESLEVDEL